MEYIAFDAHKRYTLASVVRPDGGLVREQRIPHERGALQQCLERCEHGSPVAVETIGNWYWIVAEIEAAGCVPKLVHARKAKLMMGELNKTDTLAARGLNRLQRAGTRPTVWIPPGELRDQRDLPRTRMVLVRQRTQLKNRIHATLAKYALHHSRKDLVRFAPAEQLDETRGVEPEPVATTSWSARSLALSADRAWSFSLGWEAPATGPPAPYIPPRLGKSPDDAPLGRAGAACD